MVEHSGTHWPIHFVSLTLPRLWEIFVENCHFLIRIFDLTNSTKIVNIAPTSTGQLQDLAKFMGGIQSSQSPRGKKRKNMRVVESQ